jgi:hypothetical protein
VSKASPPKRPRTDQHYAVGYGRPPVATRFRPGGIGNPKGRPKKKRTVGQDLEEAGMTRVRTEVKGRPKFMTAQQVMLHNLVRTGVRGDIGAARLYFALRDRYCGSTETKLDPNDLETEDRKILEDYLAKLSLTGAATAASSSAEQKNQYTNTEKNDENSDTKPEASNGDSS